MYYPGIYAPSTTPPHRCSPSHRLVTYRFALVSLPPWHRSLFKMGWENSPHPRDHTPATDTSSVLESVATAVAVARLELLLDGRKCGCRSSFASL